jgi:hypothetical protein
VPEIQWVDAEGVTQKRIVDVDNEGVLTTDSPALTRLWEAHQKEGTPDGVAWADGLVTPELRARLEAGFEALLANEEPDFQGCDPAPGRSPRGKSRTRSSTSGGGRTRTRSTSGSPPMWM